jgi:hypothetical protein
MAFLFRVYGRYLCKNWFRELLPVFNQVKTFSTPEQIEKYDMECIGVQRIELQDNPLGERVR